MLCGKGYGYRRPDEITVLPVGALGLCWLGDGKLGIRVQVRQMVESPVQWLSQGLVASIGYDPVYGAHFPVLV